MTRTTRLKEEMAFIQAVSILMESLHPKQVKVKVALLCHTHQVLCPRYPLKTKRANRPKLGQDLPLYFRGDKERRQDKRSKSMAQDRPADDCCVLRDTRHNNQLQKGVAQQGNLCQNFKIGKVPLSRPLPPTMPSKAKAATTEDIVIARRNLGKDDPCKGHFWCLNPLIWVRLSRPEREAWDALLWHSSCVMLLL